MEETLATEARKLGVNVSESDIGRFDMYARELIAWNEKINLTAITDPADIMKKHFIDSLSLVQVIPATAMTLIDIGSGAGFPGIPIKIVRPNLEITLLESVGKKVSFLEHIIKTLKLEKIDAVMARAEELGCTPEYRARFDVATARAVANLSTLAEYALPFLSIGGTFIAQKTTEGDEIKKSERAIAMLGGTVRKVLPVRIPSLEERRLIVIEKTGETPMKYPRRPGLPLKRPL